MVQITFSKGKYINSYLSFSTTGVPTGVFLNMVDENGNQLYSPFDINGNYIKTKCQITSGIINQVTFPANYSSNYWTDYEVGNYNWKLVFNGNEQYEAKVFPIDVEII